MVETREEIKERLEKEGFNVESYEGTDSEETVQVPKSALQKLHDHLKAVGDGVEEGLMDAAEIPAMVVLLGACLVTGRIPE